MCYNQIVLGGNLVWRVAKLEKIAFIEINNYLAKLIIAETKTNAHFNLITRRIMPIELGKDFEKDHFFKRPQIEDAIEVLKQFKQTCNMFGVEKTHMYGTFLSEMRPKNLNSFIDEVYTKCGFKLDVVDEEQQCESLYKASLGTVESNKAVSCQIEQDSIRIIQYNRRGVVNSKVLAFGPVSLINSFSKEEYTEESERIDAIKKYIAHEVSSIDFPEDAKQLKFIGIGRYFEDLSKMVRKYKKYPFDRAHGFSMNLADMDYIITQVVAMGLDGTKKLKGLEDGRLDLFVLALIIMKEIFDKFETSEVVVSKSGILEGKILGTSIVLNQEKPVLDMIQFGVDGCIMNLDERQQRHSKQVEELATMIYKELKVVHKLPKGYLKILKVASAMHDIGYVINYFKHSKHSAYAILNKEVLGLTHREQILASFVASLHHGEEMDLAGWIKYQSLFEEDDASAVKKLGVMLRLAESFDVSMNNVITDVHCDILGDSVIFKTENVLDKTFEVQEAKGVSKAFEQLFNKRLEIL